MSAPDDYLVIPDLMIIDHRRQDGSLTAPPMREDFAPHLRVVDPFAPSNNPPVIPTRSDFVLNLRTIDPFQPSDNPPSPSDQSDFVLVGPMVLEAYLDVYELAINGLILTINGIPLGFTYQSPR